jgi:hypothetical protein
MYSMAPSEIAGLLVLGAIGFAIITVLALCLPGRGKHMQPENLGSPAEDWAHAFGPLRQLPSPGQRWTVRRKAALVEAVRGGWLAIDEACQRYNLSVDEFVAWERDLNRYGVHGLRSTRYQIYRDTDAQRASLLPAPAPSPKNLPYRF